MSSSSSDSEDENIALLKQAVDSNFMRDDMFTKVASSTNGNTKNASQNDVTEQNLVSQKSQRYIEQDGIEDDLKIPKSMQDFIYKKMSKRIEDSIEFVEITPKQKKTKKESTNESSANVRLLSDTNPITKIDSISDNEIIPMKNKKPDLKRRIVEPDNYSDEEKIKLAAVDGETILKQIETKNWKSKESELKKVFHYRQNKSVAHLIEPENEFSALRKKNHWDESKIANSPWKRHNK